MSLHPSAYNPANLRKDTINLLFLNLEIINDSLDNFAESQIKLVQE